MSAARLSGTTGRTINSWIRGVDSFSVLAKIRTIAFGTLERVTKSEKGLRPQNRRGAADDRQMIKEEEAAVNYP